MSDNLTLADLQDTIQTVINTTSVWYGSSDAVSRGKALVSTQTTPPFVVVHPGDVSLLGPSARHLREYRPTRAEIAAEAQAWFDKYREHPMDLRQNDPDMIEWVVRLRRYHAPFTRL